MSRGFKIRFAVGTPKGPQSAIWTVFGTGNSSDVYVACRPQAKDIKVSLHESGRWRIGRTPSYARQRASAGMGPEDRAFHKWQRPREIHPGWTWALNIVVPASDLTVPKSSVVLPEDVKWHPSPGQGFESWFGVFLAHGVGFAVDRPEGRIVAVVELPSGERLGVIVSDRATRPDDEMAYSDCRAGIRAEGGAGCRGVLYGFDLATGVRVMADLYAGDR